MTAPEVLPLPESTYHLVRDAARTRPGGIATEWIPDPADYTRCLAWTHTDLAGTVTRIANALTALGVRRPDAVTLSGPNTSMLYAATLAAQAVGIAACCATSILRTVTTLILRAPGLWKTPPDGFRRGWVVPGVSRVVLRVSR